jgi:TetR/AcrR family transcriptional repressor of nem operon
MSKAEKTRQFIIEKTAPIFNTKGYAGTSMTDITDATGLTKGSIYGNFKGKDEVALACFDHNLKKVMEVVRKEMDTRSTYKDKLLAFPHLYEHYQKYAFPTGGCPILNTAIDADDTHPALRDKAAGAIQSWKEQIVRLLVEGAKAGEFAPVKDPGQFALALIALLEGGLMIGKVTGKAQYRKAVMQFIQNLV